VSGQACLVVMYHYVRDTSVTPFPDIRALAPEQFEQQLDWLERDYRLITVAELESAIGGGMPLPDRAALLTFDDGFVDHYAAVFPVLQARGLGGAFFLSHDACGAEPRLLAVHKTHFLLARLGASAFGRAVLEECSVARDWAGKARGGRVFGADRWEESDDRAIKHLLNYEMPFAEAEQLLDVLFARHIGDADEFARRLYLTQSMVEEMARGGMTFGYHTRSHRMLSRLPDADQATELRDGVAWIRTLTGQSRVPFCYPWGGTRTYTAETLRLLQQYGYSLAFNTVRRRCAPLQDGRYELPRFDTRDLPPYTSGEHDAVAAAMPVDEA
jgi:peptidoglycan/xylan/chitin deacetylase (PgdA/CDA1 family)